MNMKMEQSHGLSQASRFTPAPQAKMSMSSSSFVARPKFNPGMVGSGSIRKPIENRTMVMMSATSDRYRGGFIRRARDN